MSVASHRRINGAIAIVAVLSLAAALSAQSRPSGSATADPTAPTNDLPNPYRTIADVLKMPEGRTWGQTNSIDVDRDGSSIWVLERCGGGSCLGSRLDPVLHFNASGTLIKSFGAGLITYPHGMFVDKDDNVWVCDGNDNGTPAPPGSVLPVGPRPGATKGHQVFKFSPDGQLLMTLGTPGGALGDGAFFYQPDDVLVAPNGDIFVSEGHADAPGSHARIVKLDKNGRLLKTWGSFETASGQFDQPHSLAMDSRGRLFVADRNNNRIQIFDQNGTFLDEWRQFSRPSGLFIDKDDTLYVVDSESGSISLNHFGWRRGMRIGSAKDGKVVALIPDPETRTRPEFTTTSAAEGVTVDAAANIYGAEVGPHDVKKYVKP